MTTLKREIHEQRGRAPSLPSLRPRFKALWSRLKEWTMVALNHYRAAAAYEQLSRLSDAELRRRGLSRETLARDVVEAAATHRFTENSS
jgi:predicted TPR repeat methyltransferase